MKIFGQESLGRPDLDIRAYQQDLEKYLTKELDASQHPEFNSVLVFTNEKAKVDAGNAPVPTMPVSKLKDFIRKKAKEKAKDYEKIIELQKILPHEEEAVSYTHLTLPTN